MRGLWGKLSHWVVVHPVWWGVGSATMLVLLGFALDLAPVVVIAAGAVIGGLNVVHARRRGYCPYPVKHPPSPSGGEAEQASAGRGDS